MIVNITSGLECSLAVRITISQFPTITKRFINAKRLQIYGNCRYKYTGKALVYSTKLQYLLVGVNNKFMYARAFTEIAWLLLCTDSNAAAR